ncbi:MAG: N-formyl-4-amino-5-aminomethyl-2-methylpyrimidine deformylase [Anaerolineales bacterium]|nr:N-formyl-4-amino-5-aminomethyl-2-methylpyrimidine deformylase [Anaerolineales bacterium]
MNNLQAEAEKVRDKVVGFCQRLIQTPSLPGAEGEIAGIIQDEMENLGYDEVWTDVAGNVIGLLRGRSGPALMFNCHMDHVDTGDPARWSVPPYSGEIEDDAIWGRGAVDIKGPLAAQVYGASLMRNAGVEPTGDIFVTAVVMEEVGGIGTQALLETIHPDFAVVGEPSSLRVARGHRGRVEVIARVRGRAAHASAPDRGVNPHYDLAQFLLRLQTLEMRTTPDFGSSTVAPTLYDTDQFSANVIPSEAWVHLDWRNIPEESPEEIQARLQNILSDCLSDESEGFVTVPKHTFDTYTNYTVTAPALFPSFGLPADHPLVFAAKRTLDEALQRDTPVIVWHFATDGGHLMAAGIPTIGFAPGDGTLAHTSDEYITIDELIAGVAGNSALAQNLVANLSQNEDLP